MSDHELDNYDDSESDQYAEDNASAETAVAIKVPVAANKRKLSKVDADILQNDEVIKKARTFLTDNPSLVSLLVQKGTFNWWDDDQTRARKLKEEEEGSNVSKTRAYIVLDPAGTGAAVHTRVRAFKSIKPSTSPLQGPIQLTSKSTLTTIVDAIAATISCHPSNIDTSSLRFRYEEPKNSQPKPFGTSELGFHSLIEAIENIMPKNKNIIISLAEPSRTPAMPLSSSTTVGFPASQLSPFDQKVALLCICIVTVYTESVCI